MEVNEMTDLAKLSAREVAKGRDWALAASLFAGLLAFCIAKEAGVPVWRDWEIGDATDIGFLTYAVTYCAFGFRLAVRRILEENHD